MNKWLIISEIKEFNSAESIIGDLLIKGNNVVIPLANIHVHTNKISTFKNEGAVYIDYCYLILQEVVGIVWDYDISRAMNSNKRECYGGRYFRDKSGQEFWVQYEKGSVFLKTNFLKSALPINFSQNELEDFFSNENGSKEIYEIKEQFGYKW